MIPIATTEAMECTSVKNTDEQGRVVALDPDVNRLLCAANGPAALSLLLLFAGDPMTCDTAVGFALRLRRPVEETVRALSSLHALGLLRASAGPGQADSPSYWLSPDTALLQALRRLAEYYMSGSTQRRLVLRALPGQAA